VNVLQGSQEIVHFRENRMKLEETVDKLQKQFRDMQHDRQKYALEIKVFSIYYINSLVCT